VWQYVGTDLFRADDEDYWVKKAVDALGESPAERVVFTDVRFENEADYIFELRYWTGHRSSVWRIARPEVYPTPVHESEQMVGLLGEEVTILNDGSLDDLNEPVALAMDMLLNQELPGQQALDIEGWKWN
jgi:hypothetical protein